MQRPQSKPLLDSLPPSMRERQCRRAVRVGDKVLMASDPVTGPFDLTGVTVYDPDTASTWKLLLTSRESWCRGGSEDLSAFSSRILECDEGCVQQECEVQLALAARQCADRLVWMALANGVLRATEATVVSRLDRRCETLDKSVAAMSESLDRWKEELDGANAADVARNHEHLTAIGKSVDALEAVDKTLDTEDKQSRFNTKAVLHNSETHLQIAQDFGAKVASSNKRAKRVKLFSLLSNSDSPNEQRVADLQVEPISHQSDQPIDSDEQPWGWPTSLEREHYLEAKSRSQAHPPSLRAFAVYVPYDEAKAVVPLDVDPLKWPEVCLKYLGPGDDSEDPYQRIHTLSGIVFSNHFPGADDEDEIDEDIEDYSVRSKSTISTRLGESSQKGSISSVGTKSVASIAMSTRTKMIWQAADSRRNPRMNRWMAEYEENLGWRHTEAARVFMQQCLEAERGIYGSFHDKPRVRGGALLLLRGGTKGHSPSVANVISEEELVMAWMQERYVEYGPIRELRALKEGKEREWRQGHHAIYVKRMVNLAKRFLPGFEDMYTRPDRLVGRTNYALNKLVNENGPLTKEGRLATPFECRVLLTRFLESHLQYEKRWHQLKYKLAELNVRRSREKDVDHSLRLEDSEVVGSLSGVVFDSARLLDKKFVEDSEEILLNFDSLPDERLYTNLHDVLSIPPCDDEEVFSHESGDSPADHYMHQTFDSIVGKDLRPRPGQIIYALYQLHCFECSIPEMLCCLPGCGIIRAQAAVDCGRRLPTTDIFSDVTFSEAELQKYGVKDDIIAEIDPSAEDARFLASLHLRGSGHHPIEIAIRRFMLRGIPVFCSKTHLPAILPPPRLEPHEEIAMEKEEDQLVIDNRNHINYMRLRWKYLSTELAKFRCMDRRLLRLRPQVANIMSVAEILNAKPGRDAEDDESTLSEVAQHEAVGSMREFLNSSTSGTAQSRKDSKFDIHLSDVDMEGECATATFGGGDKAETKASHNLKAKNDSKRGIPDDAMESTELIAIPRKLIYEMLGCEKGHDCRGNYIPHREIDPYPARGTKQGKTDDAEITAACHQSIGQEGDHSVAGRSHNSQASQSSAAENSPMSAGMYNWLLKRLFLSRPKRLPNPAAGDRGQLLGPNCVAALKLDRLHCECTTQIEDSPVMVQIMHGVLVGASLVAEGESGSPHGAIRLCPAHLLDRLHIGLTILVYDVRSGVSVACALNGRALTRTALALKIADDDMPTLAQTICDSASRLLRLGRVGIRCTSVTLDINSILAQEPPSMRRITSNDTWHQGRRVVVSNKSAQRLKFAKKLGR